MAIVSKISSYFVRHTNIISISVRVNFPLLTALLYLLVSKHLNRGECYKVLCIGRTIFNEDIKTMELYGTKITYVVIPKEVFIQTFANFISRTDLFDHTGYYTKRMHNKEKRKYYLYLKKVFMYFRKMIHFDAVLSGNYVYSWQQEFAKVCEENGIPFIVLHKEGMAPESSYLQLVKFYTNCKFIGSKLLVYNNNMKDALLESNIVGIDEDKIEVVGVPRLDKYIRETSTTNNSVVFFSFYPEDKFRHIVLDQEKMVQIISKSIDFHKQVIAFAYNNKNINVIIKTKANSRYLQFVQKIKNDYMIAPIENLSITSSINSFELIKDSKAIIGFNSTTLIEGVLANKIIISPWFGKLLVNDDWNYFKAYPELVRYMNNTRDLEEILSQSNNVVSYNDQTRFDFLESYISNPDGNASVRAEKSIIDTISFK